MNKDFLILSILFIISLFLFKVEIKEKRICLDKNTTTMIRGISILYVILGHLCIVGFLNINLFHYLGAVGVDIFLILSGYGLTKSYIKDNHMIGFVKRRVNTVYMPYFIITSILILSDIFFLKKYYSFKDLFKGFSSFNTAVDSSMWYISFIIFWYIIFFLIFKIKIKLSFKIITLIFISFTFKFNLYSHFIHILETPRFSYNLHWYAFTLGCIFAVYEDLIIKTFIKNIKNLYIYSIFLILVFIVSSYNVCINGNLNMIYYQLYDLSGALFTLLIFLILNYHNIKSNMLNSLGKYSYYIYLTEGILIWKYPILFHFSSRCLNLTLYCVFVIISTCTLKFIHRKVCKFI